MAAGQIDTLDSLARRAKTARGLLMVFIGFAAISMLASLIYLYFEVSLPYSLGYSLQMDGGWLLPAAIGIAAVGVLGMVVSAIGICIALPMWLLRSWSNLHRLGLDGLNYTPGWAAGSLFVPFINLVVPFHAMRELCNRSSGEDAWQAKAPVGIVTIWWAALLAALFLRLMLGYVALVNAVPGLHFVAPSGVNTGLHVASILLFLTSAVSLFKVIGLVTGYQRSSSHVSQAFV